MSNLDFSVVAPPLLDVVKDARYPRAGQKGQVPDSAGVALKREYIGTERMLCSGFTTWFVNSAFQLRPGLEQWQRQIVSHPTRDSPALGGKGYGPQVAGELKCGKPVPVTKMADVEKAVSNYVLLWQVGSRDGLKGHACVTFGMRASDKGVLRLEANLAYGLDGVGIAGVGNWRELRTLSRDALRDRVMQGALPSLQRLLGNQQILVCALNFQPGSQWAWLGLTNNPE